MMNKTVCLFLIIFLIFLFNNIILLHNNLLRKEPDLGLDEHLYNFVNVNLTAYLKQTKIEFILKTPFYVYEDLIFPDAIIRNEKGKGISYEEYFENPNNRKHSDDYWFMRFALNHPMRVKDPDKAKLFYVPSLMNVIALCHLNRYLNYTYCVNDKCNYQLFDVIDKYLSNSEWFQRNNGVDHIIVVSHYGFNTQWKIDTETNNESTQFAINFGKDFSNIFNCNKVVFENTSQHKIVNQKRVNFPSMYVGRLCKVPKNMKKKHRFIFLGSFKNSERQNIRNWLVSSEVKKIRKKLQNRKANKRLDLFGNNIKFCPFIAYGKYGFHVKGDTFGSGRVIDLLLNGVIPIFTEKEQYDILPYWIPFKSLSYFVPIHSESLFLNSIKEILENEKKYKKIYRASLEFQELFDYETGVPFDMYMYHFAKHIAKKIK